MKTNLKYFQFSSIKFQHKKFKYNIDDITTITFNNNFQSHKRMNKIIEIIKKRILNFSKLKDENAIKSHIEHVNLHKDSGWAVIDSNRNIEQILIVLMYYGFQRDFIIEKIFEGNNSQHIGDPRNEVKELLISKTNLLIKIPIHDSLPNKERMIILIKDNTLFPLFIDTNHNLFTSSSNIECFPDYKLEQIFKKIFMN